VATELFALGLFELFATFCTAIFAISSGPLVASELILHYAMALATILVVVSIAVGSYRGDAFLDRWRIAFKVLLATLAALAGGAAAVVLAHGRSVMEDDASRLALSRASLSCLALLLIARVAFAYAYRLGLFTRRLTLVGAQPETERLAAAVQGPSVHSFDVLTRFALPQTEADCTELLAQCRRRKIWGVVLADPAISAPLLAQAVSGSGITLIDNATFHEKYLHRIDLSSLSTFATDASQSGISGHWFESLVHRLIDIGLSLWLLMFTFPLMLATAVAIRLDSAGPSLYRQERVGLHGRSFTLYKFRSMRTDAEASGPVWAMAQDNRVTRIGQFIRLTRIDELPQLFNVLSGEMSFIGPRPERPVFVAQLQDMIPFYACRAEVKPGLTGWAQVNYPYGASVEDARMKLSYDLYYVKHRSIYLDVTILFSTIRVILFQEGAR
jgi:exopolysaccharide biosynthesis polyprenyl glycosylphosphotransferase